jgi:hypothetical protein
MIVEVEKGMRRNQRAILCNDKPECGVKPMLLPDWLFKALPYLCVVALIAGTSWDFRWKTQNQREAQQTNPPD